MIRLDAPAVRAATLRAEAAELAAMIDALALFTWLAVRAQPEDAR